MITYSTATTIRCSRRSDDSRQIITPGKAVHAAPEKFLTVETVIQPDEPQMKHIVLRVCLWDNVSALPLLPFSQFMFNDAGRVRPRHAERQPPSQWPSPLTTGSLQARILLSGVRPCSTVYSGRAGSSVREAVGARGVRRCITSAKPKTVKHEKKTIKK